MGYVLIALALQGSMVPYRVATFETYLRCDNAKQEMEKADRRSKYRYVCLRR